MNDRIHDLLDDASDDAGRPLGFTPGDVVARGRRTRRHHTYAGLGGAVAVAGVAVTVALLGHSGGDHSSAPPVATESSTTETPSLPTLSAADQAIVDQCKAAPGEAYAFHFPPGFDHSALATMSPQQLDRYRVKGAPIAGWTLDARETDRLGTTATFVSPDASHWAVCDLYDHGVDQQDSLTASYPLHPGRIPVASLTHGGTSLEWAQVCDGTETSKICPRELFYGGQVRYAGVAEVVITAPDGTRLQPDLGRYTYVVRHSELRVAANRPSNDAQPMPSMPVRYLDAAGRTLADFDFFPPMVIPATCPPTGGC